MSLRFPLLPADRSLIEPFVILLQQTLLEWQAAGHTLPKGGDPALLAVSLGTTLFSIAILRHYLERPPEDDMTIYALVTGRIPAAPGLPPGAKRPRIVRKLTVPEQALATVIQLPQTDWNDPDISSQLMFERSRVKHTKSLPCHVDTPMAYVLTADGVPFTWSSSNGPGLRISSPSAATPQRSTETTKKKTVPPRPVLKRKTGQILKSSPRSTSVTQNEKVAPLSCSPNLRRSKRHKREH